MLRLIYKKERIKIVSSYLKKLFVCFGLFSGISSYFVLMRYLLIFGMILFILSNRTYGDGFSSLKLGSDARSGALGLAYTALSPDGAGGYRNPASLTLLKRKDFLFSVHHWLTDIKGEFLGFGWGNLNTGFGLHLLYTEVGEIEHRIVPSPEPLGKFSAHELVIGISYAKKINSRLSLGITLKTLYEKIFIDETWGLASDVGVLYSILEDKLRIGAVVQNFGKTGQLREKDIELPLIGKLGLALPLEFLGGQWIFVMDGIVEQGFPFHLHGGIEYGWQNRLFFRCGYQTGYETRDLTGGLGIVWGIYRLDYSYMPTDSDLGDSHRLSVGIGF